MQARRFLGEAAEDRFVRAPGRAPSCGAGGTGSMSSERLLEVQARILRTAGREVDRFSRLLVEGRRRALALLTCASTFENLEPDDLRAVAELRAWVEDRVEVEDDQEDEDEQVEGQAA